MTHQRTDDQVSDTPSGQELADRLQRGATFLNGPEYAAFLQRWGQDQARQAQHGGLESPEVATEREATARRLDAVLRAPTDGA